jgi:hypothetical protein
MGIKIKRRYFMTREQYERLLQLRLIFPPIRGFSLDWKNMGELYDEFVGLLKMYRECNGVIKE